MGQNMGWIISAIGLMGAFLGWYTNITINSALSSFKDSLRKEFGERFLDATLAAAKLEPMQREISDLRAKLVVIEDYAHKSRHDLANEVQELMLKLERGGR